MPKLLDWIIREGIFGGQKMTNTERPDFQSSASVTELKECCGDMVSSEYVDGAVNKERWVRIKLSSGQWLLVQDGCAVLSKAKAITLPVRTSLLSTKIKLAKNWRKPANLAEDQGKHGIELFHSKHSFMRLALFSWARGENVAFGSQGFNGTLMGVTLAHKPQWT